MRTSLLEHLLACVWIIFFLVCFIFSISISLFLRQFKFLFFFCIHFFCSFLGCYFPASFSVYLSSFYYLFKNNVSLSLSPFIIDLLLFTLLFIQYIFSFPPFKRINNHPQPINTGILTNKMHRPLFIFLYKSCHFSFLHF